MLPQVPRRHAGRSSFAPLRLSAVVTVLALVALAGCAPTVVQPPLVGELRRHEGPSLPLKAYVTLELRNFDIRGGGPLHTKGVLAPTEGVQLARDLVREKIAKSGLFEDVLLGAAPPGAPAMVLSTVLDIVVTTPVGGVTSFAPHAYVTGTYLGPGGTRQVLFADARYETLGTMADNPFALGETVMLAWRMGADAIATQMANDLPRRIGSSAVGAGLLGRAPPAAEGRAAEVRVTIGYPQSDLRLAQPFVLLAGTVTGTAAITDVQVSVNGQPVPLAPAPEGIGTATTVALSQRVPLGPGDNVIVVNARDRAGGLGQRVVRVFREGEPRAEGRTAPASSGSGFLLRNTSLVLTNYHVVRDKTQLTLHFPGGEEYQGQVVFRDRSNDLALVEAKGLTASGRGLVVSINAEIKVGETVHALGYPLGPGLSRQPSMVSGAVSSTVGLEDDIARFRMTAPINPGNSGGPIVNQRGQVIGVAVAGLVREGVEAIRFGIKASTAALILQQARVTTAFDVVVTPTGPPPSSPDQIFSDLSPSVVLIEAR